GGRLANTPISLIIGVIIVFFIMFSKTFQTLYQRNTFAKIIGNFGIMSAIIVAVIIGWLTKEYASPTIEWGFVVPNLSELWLYTPFVVGFPDLKLLMIAFPTALISYIIAYGDIVVGTALLDSASKQRNDEKINISFINMYITTFIRNTIHALFAPHPGLAGPIFTAGSSTIIERYKY